MATSRTVDPAPRQGDTNRSVETSAGTASITANRQQTNHAETGVTRSLDLELHRIGSLRSAKVLVPVQEDDSERLEVSLETTSHRDRTEPVAFTIFEVTIREGRVVAVRQEDRRGVLLDVQMVDAEVSAFVVVVEAALSGERPVAGDGEFEAIDM